MLKNTKELVVIDYDPKLYRLVYKKIKKALVSRIKQEGDEQIYLQNKGETPSQIVTYYTTDFFEKLVKQRREALSNETSASFYLLKRFIRSALNAQGHYSVFEKHYGVSGQSWRSIQTLRKANPELVNNVLYSFDIRKIYQTYCKVDLTIKQAAEILLRQFKEFADNKTLEKKNTFESGLNGVMGKLCLTILDACELILRHGGASSFLKDIESLMDSESNNTKDLSSNKKKLIQEIDGIFGFGNALSNDFFKDMGYPNFAKPDTHIMKIIDRLNIHLYAEWGRSPEERAQELIHNIALSVGRKTTDNQVDKIFWMWRSGVLEDLANLGTIDENKFEKQCEEIISDVREYKRTQFSKPPSSKVMHEH